MPELTIGVKELDEALGGLEPGTLVLVIGRPGVGKTLLASKACYENAVRGNKCLYVTFYEDKEKLFRNAGRLGIDLAEAEAKGLVGYVRLPASSPDEIVRVIGDLVARGSYRVVVIDSVNPLLELFEAGKRRAVLLNFFYQLAGALNGLLVLIAEVMPEGGRTAALPIEYVADTVIYMRTKAISGVPVRSIEVRKARGHPLPVVEVPYSIAEAGGIEVYLPPRPARRIGGAGQALSSSAFKLEELVGPIYRGDVAYVSYPAGAREPLVVLPLVDLAVTNGLRVLMISYKYSPDEVREVFALASQRYAGIGRDEIFRVLDKHFAFESLNAAGQPIQLLHAKSVELVKRLEPDIVAFHGTEVFWAISSDGPEYWRALINELTWLRNQGKLVVRYGARVDRRWTRMNEALADIVVRAGHRREGAELRPVFHVWRRGRSPLVLEPSASDLEEIGRAMRLLLERALGTRG
ncbi:MAG: ATPase domain-containing protein [Desulfurococcaceae archaeon]